MPADVAKVRTPDVRRLSLLACGLLVLLRLSIGWQFLYEGLWKYDTLSSNQRWTSEGYLKSAKGPFRNFFRSMVEDPDDLRKLDYDKVVADWEEWRHLFVAHYSDLTKEQLEQLEKLFKDSKASLKKLLVDDPQRAGVVRDEFKGSLDYKTLGDIEMYRKMLERYESRLRAARSDFELEHLEKQWNEIQAKRIGLVAPVEALTYELRNGAEKLLTLQQFSKGPSPQPPAEIDRVDRMTIGLLIVLGVLLIVGLFSRPAALVAAGLLTLFYLAVPPWPGVPEPPGPEHALIVNKNFVEIVALLALAAMPTGRWVGLDALVRRFILRRTTD